MSDGRAAKWRGMAPALIVFGLSLGYLPWAYTYDPQGRAVPVLVGWLLAGLALLDIVAHTDTQIGRTLFRLLSGRAMDAGTDEPGTKHTLGRQFVAVAWLIGFVGAVMLVGFMGTIPIYVLAFMWFQGRKPLRHAIIAAVLITFVTWISFDVLLRYEMYPGLLFGGR